MYFCAIASAVTCWMVFWWKGWAPLRSFKFPLPWESVHQRASEPFFYNRARTALMQLLWWYYKSSWWSDGCYMSCSRAACWGEIPWVFLPSLGAADKQTDISCSYPWLSLTNHPGIALPHSRVDFNFSTLAYLGLSWSYYQLSVIQDYKLNFSKHKL